MGSGGSLFRHLLAGGTTKLRSESDYKTIIDQLGGAYNAYTTYDHTAYFIHSSSEDVFTALQTLYEWMFHANWSNQEFEREHGVVIKEMERANSNMNRQVYQKHSRYFIKIAHIDIL